MVYEGQHIPSQSNSMSINNNKNSKQSIPKNERNFFYKVLIEDISVEDRAPYVYLDSDLTQRPLKFLIDTGATIGILGENAIENKEQIIPNTTRLFGIGGSEKSTETLGRITAKINFCNHDLYSEFHVIKGQCLQDADGILGFDFLFKYRMISIENTFIQLKFNEKEKLNKENNGKLKEKQNTANNEKLEERFDETYYERSNTLKEFEKLSNINITYDIEENKLETLMKNYEFF